LSLSLAVRPAEPAACDYFFFVVLVPPPSNRSGSRRLRT